MIIQRTTAIASEALLVLAGVCGVLVACIGCGSPEVAGSRISVYREAPLLDETAELRVRICSHLKPEDLESVVNLRSTAIQAVLAEVDADTITTPDAARDARRRLLRVLGPEAQVVSVDFTLLRPGEEPPPEIVEVIRSLPGSLAYCER